MSGPQAAVPGRVYVSYAWRGADGAGADSEETVNEIEKRLKQAQIPLIRDKNDLGYKGSITEFMREIGAANAVIVVISRKYLLSANCMFELLEMARNGDLHDRLFPVVLDDAKIYAPEAQLDYSKYWEERKTALQEKSREQGAEYQAPIYESIDLFADYRREILRLLQLISSWNTLTRDLHREEQYESLIRALRTTLGNSTAPQRTASGSAARRTDPNQLARVMDRDPQIHAIEEAANLGGAQPIHQCFLFDSNGQDAPELLAETLFFRSRWVRKDPGADATLRSDRMAPAFPDYARPEIESLLESVLPKQEPPGIDGWMASGGPLKVVNLRIAQLNARALELLESIPPFLQRLMERAPPATLVILVHCEDPGGLLCRMRLGARLKRLEGQGITPIAALNGIGHDDLRGWIDQIWHQIELGHDSPDAIYRAIRDLLPGKTRKHYYDIQDRMAEILAPAG